MKFIYKTKKVSKTTFVKDCSGGFVMHPKVSNLVIDNITVFDVNIISYFIEKQFLIKLKKILQMFIGDNDDNDEAILCELDSLEKIILREYKKYLSVDEIKKMLKELYVLKQKILSKNLVLGKSR